MKNILDLVIGEYSLLKHPFYQAWQKGELSKEDLKVYAKEYYHLESAFPRFLSRIHSSMENPEARVEVLKNLMSEEGEAKTHRQMWAQFAKGLEVSDEELLSHKASPQTQDSVNEIMNLCSKDWKSGLAALYAYESQQPQIAATKCTGLIQHYGFKPDSDGVEFFRVHEEADVWHSDAEARLLGAHASDRNQILDAAQKSARALWNFLDGVSHQIGLKCETEMACSLN